VIECGVQFLVFTRLGINGSKVVAKVTTRPLASQCSHRMYLTTCLFEQDAFCTTNEMAYNTLQGHTFTAKSVCSTNISILIRVLYEFINIPFERTRGIEEKITINIKPVYYFISRGKYFFWIFCSLGKNESWTSWWNGWHSCFAFETLRVRLSIRRPTIETEDFRIFSLSLHPRAGLVS
jgi:hypothetical protein